MSYGLDLPLTGKVILTNMVEKFVQAPNSSNIEWNCTPTWRKASYNTSWCLLGCSIGDMGTILYFQLMDIVWPVFLIMALAIFNGLVTSILLETIILFKQMGLKLALKTALGMSLISMVSMEVAMNLTDFILTGGAMLNWWVVPIMLVAGFITPLPYNYWRLKALGKGCCA
mgnify:CR=1 FL=1|tara:strand:+ start:442 stop:954 length:513 start_codon:yes stop_codon:yes gene_type:complete